MVGDLAHEDVGPELLDLVADDLVTIIMIISVLPRGVVTWSMVEPGLRASLVWTEVSVMAPGTRLMRWVAVCRSAL